MNTPIIIDNVTFSQLYKSHLKAVQAIVRRFRFQDAAADDLVQEIFVRAWTKRENLREPSAFSGWLMQIARNACLNECKRRKTMVTISGTDAPSGADESDVVIPAADESESLKLEFSLALIRQAVRCHKHPIRAQIAHLYYDEELSVEKICERLEMNPNTVLSHLHRFRLVISKAVLALMNENNIEFESTRRKLLRA